jgi:hypothetical protein
MADFLRHLPAVRLAMYRLAHPEVDIPPPVDGVWRAHIPLGGNRERVLAGPGQAELLDKLERAAVGG